MQRMPSRGKSSSSASLQSTKSFSRYEPSQASSTAEATPVTTPAGPISSPSPNDKVAAVSDVFDTQTEEDHVDKASEENEPNRDDDDEETVEELPVEIQSLMDRFLESLGTVQQQAPISMDRMSDLFQDFYGHVETHIGTHIAALQTRLSREQSPTPSIASSSSRKNRKAPRAQDKAKDGSAADQQMLTASEVVDKKKARRLLELKRVSMEDAVERSLCEKIYPRIWRHKSTDDDARDEKVRSRAAALKVVGVSLTELLTTAMGEETEPSKTPSVDLASSQIEAARQSLQSMNDSRHPSGKLKALKATHKDIVEALSQMFPSSSSADEILPTLIYTIIVSPPESLNVVSNIAFIQRFRASTKIDGEAAYCLTNLEAAISFLETVDLTSLRPSETPSKSTSRPSTPRSESNDPMYQGLTGTSPTDSKARPASPSSEQQKARPRSLSTMLKSGPKPFEGATGAMMESADIAYDKLHNALDGGFKYLFGRMKEMKAAASPGGAAVPAAPKTLEDARKLMEESEIAEEIQSPETASILTNESTTEPNVPASDTRVKTLELIGGKKPRMDRQKSTDSTKSANSAKHVAFAPVDTRTSESTAAGGSYGTTAALSAAESMRNLGNSFNPLRSFSGWGSMRGFGRPVEPGAAMANGTSQASASTTAATAAPSTPSVSASMAQTEKATDDSGFDIHGIGPPIQRFVDMKEPKEMNFYDVELLLRDYQRLSAAIKTMQDEKKM